MNTYDHPRTINATLADPIKNQDSTYLFKNIAGTQAAGKHIMSTLRASKKRSYRGTVIDRKVSEQHVFQTSLPCRERRRDSEAYIVRDLKARKCLDDFEGVFFMQPLVNYPNTTTPVFICTLSPEK